MLHKLALDLGPTIPCSQARREVKRTFHYFDVDTFSTLFTQAIQRTRVLLLQQGANRVLVNVLDELFADGFELNDIETDFAVEVL